MESATLVATLLQERRLMGEYLGIGIDDGLSNPLGRPNPRSP